MKRPLAGALLIGILISGCALGSGSVAPSETLGATESASPPMPEPEPTPVGSTPGQPLPEIPIQPADPPSLSDPVSAPVRLQIDGIGGIDVPVDAVGVAADGQMEIPEDANRAGWYEYGSTTGDDRGTAIIAAHAGSYITPRGPFAKLHELKSGAAISVTRSDGSSARYTVTTVERLNKVGLDFDAYFTRDGDPRLVLISCGGEWDAAAQSYRQNVIVTATLANS